MSIRLCTWNIQLGLQLDEIVCAVKAYPDFAGLDLIALQEASEHHHKTDAQTIAEVLGPDYKHVQATAHVLRGHTQANALIWNSRRVEVSAHYVLALPRHGEVQLPRAENVLLRALPRQARNSLVVDGQVEGMSLRFYIVHLDVVGFTHKREQFARVLADTVARPPVDMTIIAGDFNTFGLPERPSWAKLHHAAAAQHFDDATADVLWTQMLPRLRFRQKLDWVFTRHVRPVEHRAWSLNLDVSDHIPVFVEIQPQ